MRLALILCVVAGCGGASFPSPPTANDPDYPAGPYGYGPRNTLPDLLFAAKVVPVGGDAAATPAQMISLGRLRTPDVRAFVIATSAEWCSDCVDDQPAMMQLEAKYGSRGIVAIELLDEAAPGVAPTLDNLDRWSAAYSVSGTIALDASKTFETAAGITAFPTYFVVYAPHMNIAYETTTPLVAAPLDPALDSIVGAP